MAASFPAVPSTSHRPPKARRGGYFPIGGLRKEQVRNIARQLDLCVADKPDSVEICFVPEGDHAEVVRQRRPALQTIGNFVDRAGNVLGRHEGIEKYTIGQRKGLNYAAGARRYAVVRPEALRPGAGEIRAELTVTQRLMLGSRSQLHLRASSGATLISEVAGDGAALAPGTTHPFGFSPADIAWVDE